MDIAQGTPMDCEVFTFIEQLEQLSDADEVTAAIERILATFNIPYFMVLRDWPSAGKFEDLVLGQRLPEQWFKLYVRENYGAIDPAFWPHRRSSRPFMWLEAPIDADEHPRTAAFVRRAADFGLAQGLVVPMFRIADRQGVAWLGGPNPELTIRTTSALHLVALYAFDRLRRLHAPPNQNKARITQREREALSWAANGKTAREIGKLLGIKKRTVEEHFQAAQRKLGAVNRIHAVVLALRDGTIDIGD
jgi:LuxR family quorum sensing-dependent transcriptional regulator